MVDDEKFRQAVNIVTFARKGQLRNRDGVFEVLMWCLGNPDFFREVAERCGMSEDQVHQILQQEMQRIKRVNNGRPRNIPNFSRYGRRR